MTSEAAPGDGTTRGAPLRLGGRLEQPAFARLGDPPELPAFALEAPRPGRWIHLGFGFVETCRVVGDYHIIAVLLQEEHITERDACELLERGAHLLRVIELVLFAVDEYVY